MHNSLKFIGAIGVAVVTGFIATLGFLAFRAAVEEVYLHSWSDLFALPYYVPALLPVVALLAGAVRLPDRVFWRWLALLIVVPSGAAAFGAVAGALAVDHASGPWAGALIGAGAAVILVAVATLVRAFRGSGAPARGFERSRRSAASFGLLVAVVLGGGCTPPADPAPSESRLEQAVDTSRVEAVVFLLGDPGVARDRDFPVLRRMRQEVESWSARLAGHGDVRMVVLGDLVYPEGLHPVGHPVRETDSLRLADQITVVGGPEASQAGTRGIFLPGNHDWGQEEDVAGAVRLVRLDRFLNGWAGPGQGRVDLAPDAGRGVQITDVGDRLRLILLDTGWWLLGRNEGEAQRFVEEIEAALESAGERSVVVAAHHPMETGGPHGVGVDLGSLLGIRPLLKRAGILVQDLDSRPYSALERRLNRLFTDVRLPDVYAGGHDHSLQVFDAGADAGGVRGLVVGSASKLSGVTGAPGMLFGRSAPGYGKVLILEDGRVTIELEAAPAEFLKCTPEAAPDCVEEGVAAYETVWRETLTPATRSR